LFRQKKEVNITENDEVSDNINHNIQYILAYLLTITPRAHKK